MKSNICKIEKGNKDLEAIFKESERVAKYNRLMKIEDEIYSATYGI